MKVIFSHDKYKSHELKVNITKEILNGILKPNLNEKVPGTSNCIVFHNFEVPEILSIR